MLQLKFVFDDAIRALTAHADHLTIASLPAAVFLMQTDVINHYRYALDHYLTVPLDAPFLQDSSFGSPYKKWAYFTNEDFDLLSFTIHNLLRYTSRLAHESECKALQAQRRYSELKQLSNTYTNPICELRYQSKAIGVIVQPAHQLLLTPARTERNLEHVISRSTAGGPTFYFRVIQGPEGSEREEPISVDEFERRIETLRSESIDIVNRNQLEALRARGHAEIAELQERNRAFKLACDNFYRARAVTEPFESLNQSYWT